MNIKLVDHVSDAAEYDRVVSSCKNVPSYVGREDPKEHEKLASIAFADMENKLFPIHSKSATWLSIASFARQAGCGIESNEKTAAIIDRLCSAADIFDITSQEKDAALEVGNAAWEASQPAPCFILKIASREFQIPETDGAVELTKVANWMYSNCKQIPFPERHEAAKEILAAAASHKYALLGYEPMLQKTAGLGKYDSESLKNGIVGRQINWKVGDVLKTAGLEFNAGGMSFVEACTLVGEMDKEALLDRHYLENIDIPEFALTHPDPVPSTEKVATLVRGNLTDVEIEKNAFLIADGLRIKANSPQDVIDAVKTMNDDRFEAVMKIVHTYA